MQAKDTAGDILAAGDTVAARDTVADRRDRHDDAFADGTGRSVYAGFKVHGRLRAVVLRGRLIASDGELAPGRHGRFLAARE
jgi:hypothetical protein